MHRYYFFIISYVSLSCLIDSLSRRNHVGLNRLQLFSPTKELRKNAPKTGHAVPLEILVDYRCEHEGFTRLLPHAEATIQYDKFNRLRLRSDGSEGLATNQDPKYDHLRTQTVRYHSHIRFRPP